jgi:hypothetical protein
LLGGKSRRDAVVTRSAGAARAVRRGDWVWIDAPAGSRSEPAWWRELLGYAADDQPAQLYDLRADPGQRQNQFAAKPELVQEMRAFVGQIEKAGRHAPPR